MSEKSFAVASVSVAIIWGTFFYPPMPHSATRTAAAVPAASGVPLDSLRADKGSLQAPNPHLHPVALNSPPPRAKLSDACVFAGAVIDAGCAPLRTLAGK